MKKTKIAVIALLILGALVVTVLYLHGHPIAVLDPKGVIARKERQLIIISLLLALIVVIPVFGLTIIIAWKYRESNLKTKYRPDWDHNRFMEFIWWAIPIAIITVLSVITWRSSHQLDPYKPIASATQPIPIEVVALDWKWLFIYPEQNIASVNLVQFPVNTPVSFEITSDTVMNSFWVPSLAGQIYAMPGMSTQLHLMADQTGSYSGSSANISGRDFANMTFVAKATSRDDFDQWVKVAKRSPTSLNVSTYTSLARPGTNTRAAYYSSSDQSLYDAIITKYLAPPGVRPASSMPGMGM